MGAGGSGGQAECGGEGAGSGAGLSPESWWGADGSISLAVWRVSGSV